MRLVGISICNFRLIEFGVSLLHVSSSQDFIKSHFGYNKPR